MTFLLGIVHTLLFWCLSPFTQLFSRIRGGFWERHGFYRDVPKQTQQQGTKLWLHGASAGDVLALVPTARDLKNASPTCEIYLTTITDSGHSMGLHFQKRGLFESVHFAPWDYPGAVRRFINHRTPSALILEYTELWPFYINVSKNCGLHVFMHNARFSPNHPRKYRWLFTLYGNLLHAMTAILLRDDAERDRALELNAVPKSLQVTGNTKLDHSLDENPSVQVETLREVLCIEEHDLVWVCGSTHDGEESILISTFQQLSHAFPSLKLVLAPRYAERGQRLVELCESHQLPVSLRSQLVNPDHRVVILDSVGELRACYHLADIVFVGGSFNQRGGHNIIEPAVTGVPVLFGPNMWNAIDSVQLLLGTGGIQVDTSERLLQAITDLLQNDSLRHELGQRARERVTKASGAAARNTNVILGLLNEPDMRA